MWMVPSSAQVITRIRNPVKKKKQLYNHHLSLFLGFTYPYTSVYNENKTIAITIIQKSSKSTSHISCMVAKIIMLKMDMSKHMANKRLFDELISNLTTLNNK